MTKVLLVSFIQEIKIALINNKIRIRKFGINIKPKF